MAEATRDAKDAALAAYSRLLDSERSRVAAANDADMNAAADSGLPATSVARLRFDDARIDSRLRSLQDILELPDPVGQPVDSWVTPNGLSVQRVRAPIGVILMIYEARPHVTVNAAALALKAGNVCMLRGGSEAKQTNTVLLELWGRSLEEAGLPGDGVVGALCSREQVQQLLTMSDRIDLVIPRGGKGLIRAVAGQARMPVLKHEDGICHVFVDASADLATAIAVTLDSKCLMPEVCNAAETLLVHADAAGRVLPALAAALRAEGVELVGCERSRAVVPDLAPATDDDWATEYLGLKLSIRVVDDLDDAVGHIQRYGSAHTDTIVTDSCASAAAFRRRVDSAVTLVNASTMFDDGKTLGMGAEIGIATGRLHARGPMGLEQLTIPRLVIEGRGQVMEERFLRAATSASSPPERRSS